MDIYERLIENPLFFKWIYHPTKEIESYWVNYLKINPQEADFILDFKSQFENYFKYQEEELSETEKRVLAERIIMQMEKEDARGFSFFFLRSVLKYAAVAIICLLIGGSLVYVYLNKQQNNQLTANSVLPAQMSQPTLIIKNRQIPLKSGTAELDYTNNDEIILNNERTIEKDKKNAFSMNTLVVPYGNRSVITLADGSVVWLNAGSQLIYPSDFVGKKREVFLRGEAFFSVAKNKKHPFIVKTEDVKISVLGTKFNVSAYPEDYSVKTVLAEGSVKLNRTDATIFERDLKLVPGQMANYNKNEHNIEVADVNVETYTLWTQGLLNFVNTDLTDIVRQLERYYNITFEYEDMLSGPMLITGKLDVTKEMNEVFDNLSKLTGLKFKKTDNKHYLIQKE